MTALTGPIKGFISALGSPLTGDFTKDFITNVELPTITELANGDVFYEFPGFGTEFLYQHKTMTLMSFYLKGRPASDDDIRLNPFPVTLIEGLSSASSRTDVHARFGEPVESTDDWDKYRLNGAFVWFIFADDALDTVTCCSYDFFASIRGLVEQPEPDALTVMIGVYHTSDEFETVAFADADGQSLTFTRVFAGAPPVVIGYGENQSVGGVESIALVEKNVLFIQVSDEAAATLGVPARFRFFVAENAEQHYEQIVSMLIATGEFTADQASG